MTLLTTFGAAQPANKTVKINNKKGVFKSDNFIFFTPFVTINRSYKFVKAPKTALFFKCAINNLMNLEGNIILQKTTKNMSICIKKPICILTNKIYLKDFIHNFDENKRIFKQDW